MTRIYIKDLNVFCIAVTSDCKPVKGPPLAVREEKNQTGPQESLLATDHDIQLLPERLQ